MKKLCFLFLLAATVASAQAVKFSGKIANLNASQITLAGPQFKKDIPVDKSGAFSASFDAPAGIYQMTAGEEYTTLYFKPGYDLNLTMDAKQFDESIVYKGKGEKENNFLAQKTLMEEEMGANLGKVKSQAEFDAAIAGHNKKLLDKLSDKSLDADFKTAINKMIQDDMDQMAAAKAQAAKEAEAKQKLSGKPSPSFDYENYAGGKTKLEDLRGKYVYIDVWATWCGPCRAEIPHLQKVEEQYKGKNIQFVSISVDEMKNHDKWKQMVADKNLGGLQLFADNNWMSSFMTAYGINSIPRFILLDPQGNIVDPDAARPSDPALQEKLNGLLK